MSLSFLFPCHLAITVARFRSVTAASRPFRAPPATPSLSQVRTKEDKPLSPRLAPLVRLTVKKVTCWAPARPHTSPCRPPAFRAQSPSQASPIRFVSRIHSSKHLYLSSRERSFPRRHLTVETRRQHPAWTLQRRFTEDSIHTS